MNSQNDKSNSGWYKSLCKYINSINSVKTSSDPNPGELSNSDCTKPISPINDNKKNFAYLTPKVDRYSEGKPQPNLEYKSVFKSNTRKRQFLTSPSETRTGGDRKWLKLDEDTSRDSVHVDTPHPFIKNSRLLEHSRDVEENDLRIKLLEEEKDLLRRSISHLIHEEVKKIADIDNKSPFGYLSKKTSPSMFAYTASSRLNNEKKSLFTPTRAHLLATNVSKTSFSRWNKPLRLNGKPQVNNTKDKDTAEKESEKVDEKKPAKRKNVFSANFEDDEVFERKVSKKDASEDSVVLVQKPKVTNLAYTFSSPLNRGPLCSKCKGPVESKDISDSTILSKNEDKNSDSEVSAASSPDYTKELATDTTFPEKTTSKLWSCQACFVNNSEDKNECDCCKTPKGEVLKAPASVPSKDWSCPDCFVKNKESDSRCVCCTAMKPGTASKPAPEGNKKWVCDTCMVQNDADKTNCVCCDTPKVPSKAPESKPAQKTLQATTFLPATSNFSFGFSAAPAKSDSNTPSIFGTATSTTTTATSIFGSSSNENKVPEKSNTESPSNTSTLNSSALSSEKTENKEAPAPSFSFGLKSTDPAPSIFKSPDAPKLNPFSSTTTVSDSATKSNTSSIFGTTLSTQDPSTSSLNTTLNNTNNGTETKNSSSLFDSSVKSSPSKPSLFGTSSKPAELGIPSIFGSAKVNESLAKPLFGTTKPLETGATSLFGSTPTPSNTSILDSSKPSLFSVEKKNEVSATSLFGVKPEGNNSTTTIPTLFGSSSQQNVNSNNQLSLFNSSGNNGTAPTTSLFGQQQPNSCGTTNNLFQSSFSQPLTNNVPPPNPFGSTTNNSNVTCAFGSSTSATQQQQQPSGFNFGMSEPAPKNPSMGFNFGAPAQNNSTMMGGINENKGFDFGSAPQAFDFTNRSSSFQFGSTNSVANVFSLSPASSAAPSPIVGRRIAQAKRRGVRRN
uniref:Nuclear pore complex protein Nup153 n=1 Tax=Strongyloides venezuelensis TaxID=75913 RepID=A0A0K0FGC3_STRVS